MPNEPFSIPLKPFETRRASEVIFDQIRALITSGQLKPGDRLPSERALIDMLQRSRPTIREALRMLERSGFIRTVPGTHGAIVQELDARNVTRPLSTMLEIGQVSMEELAEYRMQNDVAIASWATFRHTQADLDAIDALLAESRALLEAKDYEAFIRLDPRFHGILAKAAKNEVSVIMTQVLSQLVLERLHDALQRMDSGAKAALCENIMEQHEGLGQVIHQGSEEEASALMSKHIYSFLTQLRP